MSDEVRLFLLVKESFFEQITVLNWILKMAMLKLNHSW